MEEESSFEARILELLQAPKTQPMTKSELARALEVPPKERSELREAVRALESAGKIEKLKKARYGLPVERESKHKTVVGMIRFSAPDKSRNAFIELDEASRRELGDDDRDRVFVPAKFAGTALPGDRVKATLHRSAPAKNQKGGRNLSRPGEPRWEARVCEIEARKRTSFVGTLSLHRGFAHVVPDDPAFGRHVDVDAHDLPDGAKDDHKILFRIAEWESQFRNPRGTVLKILGWADDAGVDILSIIHEFDLPLEFPSAVEREASGVPEMIEESEYELREDWRDREVCTIDPFDAKDFDDAICVTPLEDGWELAVFIADVAHYVRPGSQLDQEAERRGNSVYLVDRVIPMLPEALSNGICSLNPHVDRLTHAVIMEFDERGKRRKSRFAKAVICSKRRFAYEEAFALLEAKNTTEDDWTARLQEAWNLASKLRTRRMDHGSLDLDFPEVKVILDEGGKPTELRLVKHDSSHQLIEEFMLAANEAVAEFMKNQQGGGIYRVHEDPDLNKLFEFRELA
ncbi:MAG: RNB domain-containing ribonuclease, partial [Verrucomicrobiota bacterium]